MVIKDENSYVNFEISSAYTWMSFLCHILNCSINIESERTIVVDPQCKKDKC